MRVSCLAAADWQQQRLQTHRCDKDVVAVVVVQHKREAPAEARNDLVGRVGRAIPQGLVRFNDKVDLRQVAVQAVLVP